MFDFFSSKGSAATTALSATISQITKFPGPTSKVVSGPGSQTSALVEPLIQATPTLFSASIQTFSGDGNTKSLIDSSEDQSQTKIIYTSQFVGFSSISRPATTFQRTDEPSYSLTIPLAPPTTFVTLALPTSELSASFAGRSLPTTSTPAAVNAVENGSSIPVAGIVVASIMGFFAFASVIFFIFRYCAPVRQRIETWRAEKEGKTHQDVIDGITVPAGKLSVDGSVRKSAFTGHRFYAPDEPETNTRVPHVQRTGLGLGNRLSLLMQHAPFQTGNQNLRQSQVGMAMGNPRDNHAPIPLPK